MKVSALGPEGTYSSQAAREHYPGCDLHLAGSITEAIGMVSVGEAQSGVVPIENSIEGIVTVTFDELFGSNLYIRGEKVLDIHHALAGAVVPEQSSAITKIYSHPQALAQCRRYLRRYTEAELVETASTAEGMKRIAEQEEVDALAVGPEFAAESYGLTVVDREIEDETGNQTRFVAFSRESEVPDEQDFVLIAVVPDGDRPGLIHDISGVFREQEVNLSDLHSRPMRNKLGSYKFYMRLDMKSSDPRYETIAKAIEAYDTQVVRMSAHSSVTS